MKIAYLINLYPMVSLSFIRREIQALESLGYEVKRYSIRTWNDTLVDQSDLEEFSITQYILGVGFRGLLLALFRTCVTNLLCFIKTLFLCLKLGWRSHRGVIINLVYFAEACVLKYWLEEQHINFVHAHFASNSAMVALLCESLGGPNFSFTVHGPEDFDHVQAISIPEKIKRAKFVVGISSYTQSQLYRWSRYDDWHKIHIVHCGIEASFLSEQTVPLPEQDQLVCVGRLCEQKGQILLLQALKLLRESGITPKLVLVGDGNMRADIEEVIIEYQLEAQVTITGWATEAEVKTQINQAKALVLPSFAEGLPVVIMESLAMGRPVISTYIAGIPELVQPGISGWLVPAGDVAALADAIKTLLKTQNSVLAEMGQKGRVLVLQNHDVTKEAKTLSQLFTHYSAPDDSST